MPKLTPAAKLPAQLSAKARELIRRLDDEPHLGKKLVGPLKGKRSARLGRSYRIIYEAKRGYVVALTIGRKGCLPLRAPVYSSPFVSISHEFSPNKRPGPKWAGWVKRFRYKRIGS